MSNGEGILRIALVSILGVLAGCASTNDWVHPTTPKDVDPAFVSPERTLDSWGIGEERELHPGYYTKVLARFDGWTTLQIEMLDRRECITAKAKIGGKLPHPYRESLISEGAAFIEIRQVGVSPFWGISGRYTGSAEYRVVGERFYAPAVSVSPEPALDGKIIEFDYRGWRYPSVHAEAAFDQGQFDMTGLMQAANNHAILCGN